jgi:hypothetical protein
MENNFTDLMRIFAELNNNNNNQFSERLLMTTKNETQQEKTQLDQQKAESMSKNPMPSIWYT